VPRASKLPCRVAASGASRPQEFTSTEVVYEVTGTDVIVLPGYGVVTVMRGGHLAILRSGFDATKESKVSAKPAKRPTLESRVAAGVYGV
jgi:hypothetical protein